MANTLPAVTFVDIVSRLKSILGRPVHIAEVGVDRGATTMAYLPFLHAADVVDLYDYKDCRFFDFLHRKKVLTDCAINIISNEGRLFSSYSWELAVRLRDSIANGEAYSVYDAVYLDGAHTFHVDASATICLKEMVRVGGYIVFDDMNWTLALSRTCNTEVNRERYSEIQMNTPQVQLVVDIVMRLDNRFKEISEESSDQSVFLRIS